MNEIWKELYGYNGYCISDNGRIKTPRGIILKNEVIQGYNYVILKEGDKIKRKKVARLVAITFIPNPEKKPCVDHINTIKTDDRKENLRWVTYKENIHNPITYKRILDSVMKPERLANLNQTGKNFSEEHKMKIGLSNKGKRGCGWARKSVLCIEKNIIYESMVQAQKETGVFASSIGKVCLGERKTAGGYHWCFVD